MYKNSTRNFHLQIPSSLKKNHPKKVFFQGVKLRQIKEHLFTDSQNLLCVQTHAPC